LAVLRETPGLTVRSRPGRGSSFRATVPLLGPAFVAAIAYVDPGNFATNFTAGATYGYQLIWVVVVANVMAMLIQFLAGKLALATGGNLAELCREHYRPVVSRGLWVQAETMAMATDLAEIIGGAIALRLLFDVPLLVGGLITSGVALALLAVQGRGHRPFELVISGFLGLIVAGFLYSTVASGVEPNSIGAGLIPSFAGTDSVLIATGMLGATVMPHAIFLHSALMQHRAQQPLAPQDRRELLRRHRYDVVIAMGVAGLANLAMLLLAARHLSGAGLPDVESIDGIHGGLEATAGSAVALIFACALLASGFASSGVGTYAGQVVMQGFIRRRIPLVVRRTTTIAPALVLLASGVHPTEALVVSQVVLSFGIPFALLPLVLLTRRRDVMGDLVNARSTTTIAWLVAAGISALNGVLLAGLVLA
jgi:manganese transport protein